MEKLYNMEWAVMALVAVIVLPILVSYIGDIVDWWKRRR